MAKKHWIYIKRGLSEDPKHRAAMGECVWLFMHIIDLADWETGIVNDWKDEAVAADMSMPITTLRHQRRKLEEMEYIKCQQGQRSQSIVILEWINPREYSGGVMNRRILSDLPLSPSEFQGDNYGDNAGDNHPGSGINTPSLPSESKPNPGRNTPALILDFKNMTVTEARKLPTIRLYIEATEQFPASVLWETLHNTIIEKALTFEQLHSAAVAWIGKGYRPENVTGILEWATNGIPSNVARPAQEAKPAINDDAVEATKRLIENKNAGEFVPPPAGLRPAIAMKSLADRKGVRR